MYGGLSWRHGHDIFFIGHHRYYSLDAYYKRQMEKENKKGVKKVLQAERTVFNDEEQRRYILMHHFMPYFFEVVDILVFSALLNIAFFEFNLYLTCAFFFFFLSSIDWYNCLKTAIYGISYHCS